MRDEPMRLRLLDAEHLIDKSFFPPDYIPKWACTNGKYPMVEDVSRYVDNKKNLPDMFEPEDGYACMSLFHGICE
jgi:hypothetical protein